MAHVAGYRTRVLTVICKIYEQRMFPGGQDLYSVGR